MIIPGQKKSRQKQVPPGLGFYKKMLFDLLQRNQLPGLDYLVVVYQVEEINPGSKVACFNRSCLRTYNHIHYLFSQCIIYPQFAIAQQPGII